MRAEEFVTSVISGRNNLTQPERDELDGLDRQTAHREKQSRKRKDAARENEWLAVDKTCIRKNS